MNGEYARLAALQHLNILDTPPEQSLDRITRLARMALDMPMAMVSLVDRDRQWFKSKDGLTASEHPRSISFCSYAIQQPDPYIVDDATAHPLFHDNPLVTGDPHIRFYVGIPLVTREGHAIGTLCALDRQPRRLSENNIGILRELAQIVIDEIELRAIASTDSLTGALTRRGFDSVMAREFERTKRSNHSLSLVVVDIDHFKSVNDRYGHASGDVVLRSVVGLIKQELRSADFIARLGGEEFVVVLPETDIDGASLLAERIRKRISSAVTHVQSNAIRVTASFGMSSYAPSDVTWAATLEKADVALYEAKRKGRNRCVCFAHPASGTAAA